MNNENIADLEAQITTLRLTTHNLEEALNRIRAREEATKTNHPVYEIIVRYNHNNPSSTQSQGQQRRTGAILTQQALEFQSHKWMTKP